jgi:predicted ArsR family transcriptional regulator
VKQAQLTELRKQVSQERRDRICQLLASGMLWGTGDVSRELRLAPHTTLVDLRRLQAEGKVEPYNAEHGGGYVWRAT